MLAEDEGEKLVQTACFRFNCFISKIRLVAGLETMGWTWQEVGGLDGGAVTEKALIGLEHFQVLRAANNRSCVLPCPSTSLLLAHTKNLQLI